MNLCCNISYRNFLSITTLTIAFFALFTGSTVIASDNEPVTVYQNVNFGGSSLDIGEGDVSIAALRASSVGNDRISSIEIASGYQVVACRNSGFRGRCEFFTSDVLDLRDIDFNDVISSLRVSKVPTGPVTVYRNVNFGGSSLDAGEGDVSIADLRASSVGNDRISSIEIAPGYQVVACRNSGFRGRCEFFTNDVLDLRDIDFNDVISSLRISKVPTGPVTVYRNVNFGGSSLDAGEGDVSIADLRASSVGNDTISSIQIAPGYQVVACQNSRFRGRCETFSSNDLDLRDMGFNDVISSLRIARTGDNTPAENSSPVTNGLALRTSADVPISFTIQQLLDASSDPDGDDLTFVGITIDQRISQLVDVFTYDPATEFAELPDGQTGQAIFPYLISDGINPDVSGQVVITVEGTFVEPPPPPPLVAEDFNILPEVLFNASIGFDLFPIISAFNTERESLTITVEEAPSGLTPIEGEGGNLFTYSPPSQFQELPLGDSALVTVGYVVSDGQDSASGTFTLTVIGTFEPPLTTFTFFADEDQDGFGDPENTLSVELEENSDFVPSGFVTDSSDCNDRNSTVFPGAEELLDGLDNNCNGETDENLLDPGPGPDVFAIAYTNVNGIPGFSEAAGDVMIAQWVDGSVAGGPDGEIGEGDFIEFGQYPTSFAGTGPAGFINDDFASFDVARIVVEDLPFPTFFNFESDPVFSVENVEGLIARPPGGITVFFGSSVEQETLLLSGPASPNEVELTDVVENIATTEPQETIAVGVGSFSSESLDLARQVNDGDQPYIDVELFIPPLQILFPTQ